MHLSQLVWRNRLFRERIIVSSITIPILLFTSVILAARVHLRFSISYVLAFLSGWFYCMSVTIFSISLVFSYLKYLLLNRLLLKMLLFVYLIGVISALVNCFVFWLISLNYQIGLEFEQISFAFIINNLFFPPVCLLIASYDNIKMDLFGPKQSFFQPRSIHVVISIFSFMAFSLAMSTYTSGPKNLLLLIVLILISLNLFFVRFIKKRIYTNCQNTIAS